MILQLSLVEYGMILQLS